MFCIDVTLSSPFRCRRTIAIAAIIPNGTRMKSAMRMPIAKPFAKRGTTGWDGYQPREPVIEFHGSQ